MYPNKKNKDRQRHLMQVKVKYWHRSSCWGDENLVLYLIFENLNDVFLFPSRRVLV